MMRKGKYIAAKENIHLFIMGCCPPEDLESEEVKCGHDQETSSYHSLDGHVPSKQSPPD